mmetsp:Transcript_25238/g.64664  ORF Transcript_25238/g.64664 Transcript_25238/m.64664 type:complete len:374 (-) Transcript_25238:8-1129(-)
MNIAFGTGEVSGIFVRDWVCLGSPRRQEHVDIGLTDAEDDDALDSLGPCVQMNLISAVDMTDRPFATASFDGVLGLGLAGLAATSHFSLHEALLESVGDRSAVFSVYISPDHMVKHSEITFGGTKAAHMRSDSAIVWMPVVMPELGYWLVEIAEVRIAGVPLSFCGGRGAPCRVIWDTGTSLIAAPRKATQEIRQRLKAPLKHATTDFGCRSDVPHAELEFVTKAGEVLSLNPGEYGRLVKRTYRKHALTKATVQVEHCEPAMMDLDVPEPIGPHVFVLGEPLFKKFYTIFDPEKLRVGAALAMHEDVSATSAVKSITAAVRNTLPMAVSSTRSGARRHRSRVVSDDTDAASVRSPDTAIWQSLHTGVVHPVS